MAADLTLADQIALFAVLIGLIAVVIGGVLENTR